MDDYEVIRRAYFHEGKSIRTIAREQGHDRRLVRKAIAWAEPPGYTLKDPREAPMLGSYKARIDELLAENKILPRKQRYTSRKIYEIIEAEGYQGSESGVRSYVAARREATRSKPAYLPLEFDPGQDAQMDWYEAQVWMAGEQITVQVFVMRLNYSRAKFVMAFPFQKQEAFLEGHVQAFLFFGAVPYRITYDNLKTAVLRILEGRNRVEQARFIGLRATSAPHAETSWCRCQRSTPSRNSMLSCGRSAWKRWSGAWIASQPRLAPLSRSSVHC